MAIPSEPVGSIPRKHRVFAGIVAFKRMKREPRSPSPRPEQMQ